MAFQSGAACFDTVGAAARSVASAAVGQVVPAGSAVYVTDAVGADDGSITYTLHQVGSVATVSHVLVPSFPPCQLLGASEAVEMGWGVALAWIAVWGLVMLRRSFV